MKNIDNHYIENKIRQLLNPILNDEPGAIIMARFDNGLIYQAEKGLADISTKHKIDENSIFNLA